MTVLLNVELALSEGVPELDGSVTRTGNDLTVVGGEGDGENVRGVSNEATGGKSRIEVPKTEGLVPRGGKSELTVRRNDNVRDEVVVSVEDTLGVSERRLCKGKTKGQFSLVPSFPQASISSRLMSAFVHTMGKEQCNSHRHE